MERKNPDKDKSDDEIQTLQSIRNFFKHFNLL